ncbi:GIY-YIG nuclease family protein [Corallincola platygyrae]|uniref:GIY-YIG nuclease family protein n=1 Tax=Corallincola platygyrae TaxID=1193278 RepID=A0ABW4XM80_9GAMM
MPTFNDLKEATDVFFKRHWDKSSHTQPYEWVANWPWRGSVPHHDKAGVYALIDGEGEIVYVGLGASRGGGLYKEHGISRRLLSHVITTDTAKGRGNYKPKPKWQGVVDIAAIGFSPNFSYLAPALEDYLIGELEPKRNKVKKKGT